MTYNPQGSWQPPHAQQPWGQQATWGRQPSWSQPPVASQPSWGQPAGAQPGWGQQVPVGQPSYGQPGGQPMAPLGPPKKSNAGRMLLAAMGLVIVAGVVWIAVSLLSGHGVTAGGYVNETYTPPPPNYSAPPLPTVRDSTQATQLTADNTFYQQTVPGPTNCQIRSDLNLETASDAELETYLNSLVGCLMRVWDGPVKAADYQMPRPPVTVYSTAATTKCGKLPMQNAVYCSGDQRIYYAKDLPTVIPPDLRSSRFVVEAVIAHEFGHAIQARTGILRSYNGLANSAGTKALANEMSRRGELQADCFSGEFLRSVSQSARMTQADLDNISRMMEQFGDDSLSKNPSYDGNHGLAASRRYWVEMGMASTQVRACNTFVSPATQVR